MFMMEKKETSLNVAIWNTEGEMGWKYVDKPWEDIVERIVSDGSLSFSLWFTFVLHHHSVDKMLCASSTNFATSNLIFCDLIKVSNFFPQHI
jgi:hypothetical protein